MNTRSHGSPLVLMAAATTIAACGGASNVASPSPSSGPSSDGVATGADPSSGASGARGASGTGDGGGPGRPANGSTFADDLRFLEGHGKVLVLENAGGARVALSAKYQGRVMTSAVDENGRSFGWINRDFIESGKTGTHFDNYGGEDRFWLGPEAGQYGLYFAPGAAYELPNWVVPAAFQEGEWQVVESSKTRAAFRRTMVLKNWSGAEFSLTVDRQVELTDGPANAAGVKSVSFRTHNRITNTGKTAWKKETGLLSVWILGQYMPASDTRVIIPFATDAAAGKSKIVNDVYFGKVSPDRLQVREDLGFLLYKCDGQKRGKIGVGPLRAKPVLGSYSAETNVLTVVQFEKGKPGAPYVNSLWEKQSDPYAGDVVNSYNDGPSAPGEPVLGGFYELETSSSAQSLKPGESMTFTQSTHHLVGSDAALEPVAKDLLGVSLEEVRRTKP